MEFSNQTLNKSGGGKVEGLVNLFTIMKKILFALSMLAFAVSALPQARGADVSTDFFYDNLSGGNWIDVEGYGYGWQPDLAVSDPNWRPYADGYWAYTDYGWTWISYEDFGWATYHYGRWANLGDYGWVWFPGSDLDWGPAWVSWRTGGDYIGWAPLPPRGPGVVYEGQPIGANVDITFGIGPEYYNFCDVRFIGEPVLRDRIFPPVQNITYITNTVNVTNITVQNNVVYNYGPNFNVVNQYSSRPIQRLTIERETPNNLSAAVKSGTLTKVQGNKLLIAAPTKIAKAPPTAKPPAVKAKVAEPKLERGWKGVPNRAELEQKIKNQNPKNIPPPTRAAAREAGSPAPGVGTSPAGTSGGAEASPGPRGKRGRVMPGATGAPSLGGSPFDRGKGKPGARPGAKAMPEEGEGRVAPSPFERGKARPAVPGASPKPAVNPRQIMRQDTNVQGSPAEKERGKPGSERLRSTPFSGQGGAGLDKSTFGERAKPAPTSQANTERELMDKLSEGRRNTKKGQDGYAQPRMAPNGGGPREPQGEKERGQPGINKPPTTSPPGAGEHGQRGGGQPTGFRQPGTQAGGAGSADARGQKERTQGAHVQPPPPQRGGVPGKAERGQAQEQPEGGKRKPEKGTPPPRPQ